MSDTDFVVTAHALERMVERWPEEFEHMPDDDIAMFIHGELNDAFDNGRYALVPPSELVLDLTLNPHRASGTGKFGWTKDKLRGYVYRFGEDGLVVMTVVKGKVTERAATMRRQRA